jgi:glutamine amidotransferase
VTIGVVDVGCGNTRAVLMMLRRIGVPARPLARPDAAGVLVLPGVGAWDAVAARLAAVGWVDALAEHVAAGRPLLGICLGMQLLCASSDEGSLPGLGIFAIPVRRLPVAEPGATVPRVGWRSTWLREREEPERYYYAHSYAADADVDAEEVAGWSRHGSRRIPVVLRRDRITGCQFHPERSHAFGMRFLSTWAESVGIHTL